MRRLFRPAAQWLFAAASALPLVVQAAHPASAQTSAAPVAVQVAASVSPGDARRALDVLQNDTKRAETISTLRAIAAVEGPASAQSAAAPASSGTAAVVAAAPVATAATAPAAAAPAPASSSASPKAAAVPLEADGLIARLLHNVGRWEEGLRDQTAQLKRVAQTLPGVAARAAARIASGPYRAQLGQLLLNLVIVFAIGLGLEWLLTRGLQRPRKALVEHADQVDSRARRDEALRDALRRQPPPNASPRGDGSARTRPADAEAATPTAAAGAVVETRAPEGAAQPDDQGSQGPDDSVALLRTQRDGKEVIEAVPVAPEDSAGATPASPAPMPAGQASAATVAASADATTTAPDGTPPRDHWRTLRHFPFAIASLVLELIPPVAFFVLAGTLLHWLPGDARLDSIAIGFVEAYLAVRIAMCVLRLLVSPVGHGLRLVCVAGSTSRILLGWSRRILIIAMLGVAGANALHALGASREQALAFIKAVSLVVHVCLVILIFRLRRPVAQSIAAPPGSNGPLVAMRHWLAQAWAPAAAILVMGLWVVWALGVEDGYARLLHFAGGTIAVLIAARLVAVLVLGGVAHVFHPSVAQGQGEEDTQVTWARRVHTERYYPLARAVVTGVLVVCSAVALLQVWGVNALSWFAHGTLGRSFASAAVTILVAAVIAVLVWELANAGVDRRLTRWTDAGDVVRAARLRTLLPMLRTFLLVIIVLIVGLTALNQIGVNTTPLLAGASIIGVALGFGSQKLVQDFITGIFLLMENAMQVGDWVTVGSVSGSVEYLSIRTVRLRGGDGSLYIVPFSSVTTVNNTNRGIGNAAMRVSVTYETDVGRAIDTLRELGAGLRADDTYGPMILGDIEIWGVDAVDGGMFAIAGQIRCTDKGRWGVQRELNRRILERFRREGIVMADPRTSVLLTAEPPGSAEALPAADPGS